MKHNFRNLSIWQDSIELAIDIYKITRKFPSEEKFGLVSQINRAVVSIPSNIAEGSGRNSNNEFKHFLGISIGSSCELETQLIIAQRLGFVDIDTLTITIEKINSIQKRTEKFKQSLN